MKSLLHVAKKLYFAIGETIAPPRCNGCNSLLITRAILCVPCNQSILPVVSTSLAVTERHQVPVFAVGVYQEVLKHLICAKHAKNQLAGSYLGELIWYRTPISTIDCDYIIPLPLHWTRRIARGFNQADEMAGALSRKSGKPVMKLLRRTKRTQFQTLLSAPDRAYNVSDAFELSRKATALSYTGKHLVLVDDLMTTGATLRTACRELLKLKPASLTCVVVARTV